MTGNGSLDKTQGERGKGRRQRQTPSFVRRKRSMGRIRFHVWYCQSVGASSHVVWFCWAERVLVLWPPHHEARSSHGEPDQIAAPRTVWRCLTDDRVGIAVQNFGSELFVDERVIETNCGTGRGELLA